MITENGTRQSKRHVHPHLVLHPCGCEKADELKMCPIFLKRSETNFFFHFLSQGDILPVKGSSSTRLQPLLLFKTLYLVTAGWACRLVRTLVTPSPASFILKRGLKAICDLIK